MSDPEGDRTGDVDTDEAVERLVTNAPPPRAAGPLAAIRTGWPGAALAQPGRQGSRCLQGTRSADPGPGPRRSSEVWPNKRT